jgi:hypothetical protein
MVQPHKDVPLMLWVISGKNAMQLFLMVIVVLSGLPILLGLNVPTSAAHVLPIWAIQLWGFALTLGGTSSLVGTYWRGPHHERGLMIEQYSKALLGFASTVYPTCLLIAAPNRTAASYVVILTYGFAIACLGRFLQIRRDRRQYRVFRDAIAGVDG